jgi:hypothetical protein
MQRLILHLKHVDTVEVKASKGRLVKKTFNTVNYKVTSESQIADRLFQHRDNIASKRLTACK